MKLYIFKQLGYNGYRTSTCNDLDFVFGKSWSNYLISKDNNGWSASNMHKYTTFNLEFIL